MSSNIVLGQYVPGSSYLYKLDPRSKILASILLMVAVFFLNETYMMLTFIGLLCLALFIGKVSIVKVLKGLKPLILLSLFIFFFQIFFNESGEVVYSSKFVFSISSILGLVLSTVLFFTLRKFINFKTIWLLIYLSLIYCSLKYLVSPNEIGSFYITVYSGGINTAIFVFFRMVALVFIATILTLTTKPTDLTLAIEWMFKPLKIFKINSEEIALIITIALRYIPTILEEAQKIMDAQASRGADFKSSNIFKKVKQLVTLLVPMFVISFERSDELADAMMTRNFVPGKVKTKYHKLDWELRDTILMIISFVILGGSICLSLL